MPRKKENEIRVVNIRLVREPSFYGNEPVSSPGDALRVVANELKGYDREVFAVLNLKTNGRPINLNICSVGTLDASLVSPREVFKSCILSNAAAFIAIHNHPSGTAAPSKEDMAITEKLSDCARLMDIRMLDHIIIAGETGELFSFKEKGLIPKTKAAKAWER
jgi:DNA repair protein RadC